jgi:translation initiation factor IF-3
MRLAEDVKEIGIVEQPPLLDGRNMVMVLGPTKNAGMQRRSGESGDAEAENAQRSKEAVQGDSRREAAPPPRDEEPPAGEEVIEAEAELPSGRAAGG